MRSPNKSRSRRNNRNRNNNNVGNIINRVFDSNGPDGRVRGTPNQMIEKYQSLSRDALLAGNRVEAESFAQHAEHYIRLLAHAQAQINKDQERRQAEHEARQQKRNQEAKTNEAQSNETQANEAQSNEAQAKGSTEFNQSAVEGEQPTIHATNGSTETMASDAQEKPKSKPRRKSTRTPKPKEAEAQGFDAETAPDFLKAASE